ncbi:MAG: restriction endonuclease subunit S [Sulfuricella sp.]|nr:restriction endonuclease subunit S [Sulfuricella sp.]
MTMMALGQTARFINGAAFKPTDWGNDGLPIIRIQNLTGTGDKFNFTTRQVKAELVVEPGDLLVSWSATLDVYRWAGPRGLLNQHIFKVLPKPEIDPDYLFFALKSALAELSSKTHGSTMKHVVRGDFESTQIRVPPLDEQRRIVDILSRAEGIVRLRREAERKAAELVPGIFIDMFGDPATNPRGWPMEPLPSVLSRPFKNGLYLPKDKYAPEGSIDGIEMVHMSDAFYGEVRRGHLRRVLADEKHVREYGLSEIDLLVARRSLTFEGAAKLCGIPSSEKPLLFESSFIRLSPSREKLLTEYLLCYLNSDRTRQAHILSRISGITISGINQAALSQIPVMLPPLSAQEDFVMRVQEVRSIESQQSAATEKAEATFDALMTQVFS